ncbi:MAG: hypothetical protein SF066_07445, partial [Thermoanaerobaculia bacterium]|nr:hypothetical protein [Thermoanaerobaculia bacterium]
MTPRFRAAIALALVTLLSAAPALAQVAASKEDLHAQLASLATQIDTAKAVGSASLASLLTQYRNLSAQLGGDQPPAPGSTGSRALRVFPTPPPQCSAGTLNFAQTTPVAIPTGPA